MVYHGHGFTWTELYNMPTWLRKFYYKKMEEAMKAQNDKQKKSASVAKPPKAKISRPGIGPK